MMIIVTGIAGHYILIVTGIARPNVAKIAIVLTDGLSADERQTAKESRIAQKLGIKTFAIGIGTGVDMIEIRNIASEPSDDYVFQVADFGSLDAIKETLAIKTCGVAPAEQKQRDQPGTEIRYTHHLKLLSNP